MNVSLTPKLSSFVDKKVKSGFYHTASEVVREGLRLLEEKDSLRQHRLKELRQEINLGLEQAYRGESKPMDVKNLIARVKKHK
jgi:antitoxin ParD1/3/4